MTREEAKTRLRMLLGDHCVDRCLSRRFGLNKCAEHCKFEQAVNMAIEALSTEQKEEDLAKDIARRMATIIENEEDMRVVLKNASAEPTVIRCRTLLSDEDFKAVAERIREINQNVIVIPCETEVVSTETSTETTTEPTDLISRADAIDRINGTGYAEQIKENLVFIIRSLPSAKVPTKCIAEIKIDADEVAQKIKEKYDLDDRPSVAYICDGKACGGECDECHHTTDIEHAKNFKYVGGKYIETDDRPSWEWIPCSERMPEDGQGVIICTDDKRFKDHPVGTCTYEHGRFHTNYRHDISMIAWMPLPKPYCPNCGAKMGGNK